MKLGVYSPICMTLDVQTNVIPLLVDIEIIAKEPRQSSHGA